MSEGNTSYYGLSTMFHHEVEPIKTRHTAAPCKLIQPKFSNQNPFIHSGEDSYCFQSGVANKQSDNHQRHVPPLKLDSGAQKSVFPLCHYNAIHPDVRPPLQPSIIETLIGVGPGDIPVLGEAHIPVQIHNRQVSVLFPVADIDGDEALLGHPFLSQAQARLDFGNQRIVLF